MLCQRQLLLLLASAVVSGWASSSEYLIIRHGRSRVRHSSEKDHIRWGLQVFDNFTLLDYDVVGGSGSGSGGDEQTSNETARKPAPGGQHVGGPGDSAASGEGTLTIQFNESEELERMIEVSDFENLRYGVRGAGTPLDSARPPSSTAKPSLHGKLIKKEIMENIRRTVDKGLAYLKSHKNLDEVKIELVPFREPDKRPNRLEEESIRPTSNAIAFIDRPPLSSHRSAGTITGAIDTPGEISRWSHRKAIDSGSSVRDYPNDDDGLSVADVGLGSVDQERASVYDEPTDEEATLDTRPQDDDPLLQEASVEVVSVDVSSGAEVDVDVNNIFHMEEADLRELDETSRNNRRNLMKGRDVVTQFLQIVESQHLLGANCTAGTALNLGEGVVDRYAQDRFRIEADIAVNRANMLTRIFKFSSADVQASEHLLHASVLSMVEFDDDIFAGGNCFDWNQHPAKRGLFCPFAYRLPPPDQGASLVKDLALEYHYLGNTSEWFFLARKNAEKVIARNEQYIKSFHVYTNNTERQADEILSVKYEDGRWSKPYYDCGGGNIWMLTYTVPFFGYENGTYFFKGTSGIDIDLRRVDIDQCSQKNSPSGAPQPLNIFAGTDKCKQRTTECTPIPGLGFRRGSYRCICRKGYYFPDTTIEQKYFNGSTLEEEYEKLMLNEYSTYSIPNSYECLQCAEGCDSCEDASPCVAALNWPMRTSILVLACAVIGLLPPAAVFTFKYQQVKVVRAASPALLRVIALGAFCIYCTSVVMYPPPSLYSCTARIWLREIGFSLTYGALMLKTWRISVIFRVRSAKAVKITDAYLLRRIGVLCGCVGIALLVRTLVAPPVVIVGRTADNLKAFLCKTDWWDHTFTSMEVLFLAWGVRLCIMVRKAPSEFNESRFISMAIYNEFLLTCFLNVSMLFLQSPANPDLLYIIFFCHTQLTVTLLLALIFGSKVYLVFRGGGKHQDDPTGLGIKPSGAKFISRSHGRTFANASSVTTSTAQLGANIVNEGRLTETEAAEELKQLYTQLQRLYERIPQRGAAILTVASLMEACRCSTLKPPALGALGAASPLKAIQAGPTEGTRPALDGTTTDASGASPTVQRLDKSTNTRTIATIPNGTGVCHGAMVASQTRITITDDELAEAEDVGAGRQLGTGARSIDGSDFRLDHQQLQCMCSGGAEEDRCGSDQCRCCGCGCCPSRRAHRQREQPHNDSVINYSNAGSAGRTVNCNCKISAVNDVSEAEARDRRRAKQPGSELVLSCQFSGAGGLSAGLLSAGQLQQQGPLPQQQQQQQQLRHQCVSSTSSDYSELSTKAFESCDNPPHQPHRPVNHQHCHPPQQQQQQQQQRRQRQTSCSGDNLDNHAPADQAVRPGPGAGATRPVQPSAPPPGARAGNLEKFNKLYADSGNRIDSLQENFLMRAALTTALQNLENENRSRGPHPNHRHHRRSSADGADSSTSQSTAGATESASFDEQLVSGMEVTDEQSRVRVVSESIESSLSSPTAVGGEHPTATTATGAVPSGGKRIQRPDGSPLNPSDGNGSSGSGSANTLETAGAVADAGGGSGSASTSGTGSGKKKKSPEKRLVIDLNDRSKYTEEVSV
ncbi:uncharacterized protein LOC128267196 [Anopheles cruzii]|uniref:uncharacterized protein LOC128267196 n=1 Tax=Anopheles cruzii TaxID=68878 RepID=UPI0022EC75FF|nr:uncharacterized protein LOC128267196 [Anopheles cruzii]